MKKFIKLFAVLFIALSLSSCNVSEKMADKIDKAYQENDPYTYKEVIQKLGRPSVDSTKDSDVFGRNGWITYYKGCKTQEEFEEKYDNGKTIEVLVVTFLNDLAIDADYSEICKK